MGEGDFFDEERCQTYLYTLRYQGPLLDELSAIRKIHNDLKKFTPSEREYILVALSLRSVGAVAS